LESWAPSQNLSEDRMKPRQPVSKWRSRGFF